MARERDDPVVSKAIRDGEAILKSLNYRCAEKCCLTCGHSDKAYDEIRSCDRLPYAKESHGFRGMWVWAWMVCDGWEPIKEKKDEAEVRMDGE